MAVDLNDAPEQMEFGVIPDGTFVKLITILKGGGANIPGMDPADNGLFTLSKRPGSDVVQLVTEMMIEGGPHHGRKLFENFTMSGGEVDAKGSSKGWNMSKIRLRAMLESAMGLSPKDESPNAKAARQIGAFSKLHGCPFWAKLTVQPAEPYIDQATGQTKQGRDRNAIERIIVATDPEYAALRAGQEVPPKPSGLYRPAVAPGAAAPAAGNSQAAWATPAQPPAAAAAAPAPAAAWGAPATGAPAAAPAQAELPNWAQPKS